MSTRVYVIGAEQAYEEMFEALGCDIVISLLKAELVCFTGGADVSPAYYGDKQHQFTYSDARRDAVESNVFKKCVELGIPMVGICRGGQFLNVMNGGRMYQHVDSHTRAHHITDVQTGEVVYVSSTHHQMMLPTEGAELVAYSQLGGAREWFDKLKPMSDVSDKDIEVVYYENTRSLCFQPHPEFRSAEYEGMLSYFNGLLERFKLIQKDHSLCGC